MNPRRKPKREPRSHGANDKLHDWEASVKARVIAFEVEQTATGLAFAHWLPPRHARRRGAFVYHLPSR